MSVEVQSFFNGFNFDTLLALISCIASVVALFLGGAAYKQCQINKNSFNDSKTINDDVARSFSEGGKRYYQ